MSDPKRVLMVAGKMHFGGLETMLMNFFRYADREKIMFDFMLNYKEPGAFDGEILSLGGKIHIMPRLFLKNLIIYTYEVFKFFKKHKNEYEIVHGNLTSAGIIYLAAARFYGVKTRIIHAHVTDVRPDFKGLVERLMMFPLRFCADYYFACSDAAARFCFGKNITKKKNYKLIKNGIDAVLFKFSPEIREKKRAETGLSGKFVIGHIGRFEAEKNHGFLLKAFFELQKKDESAHLLLIGSGSLRDVILTQIDSLGLTDKVTILDNRTDINELMQAMDVFVLPSLHEGLPVVGVEAQAAGLKCFISDAVTTETDITGLVSFLPINDPGLWADEINKAKGYTRTDTSGLIRRAGYDIREVAAWLTRFYSGEETL